MRLEERSSLKLLNYSQTFSTRHGRRFQNRSIVEARRRPQIRARCWQYIIEIAKRGERDPVRLQKQALEYLRRGTEARLRIREQNPSFEAVLR